ncbi:MAG: hypothetical protein ACRDRH_12415 [Pseudonocardia sp.]
MGEATPTVEVLLARQDEIDSEDGQPVTVAGRTVLVLPGSYTRSPDKCLVQVPHRRFFAPNGLQRVEKLQVLYTGTGTPEELCRVATELAGNAIPKLPPIS